MVTLVLTPDSKTAGNVKFTVDKRTGQDQPGAKGEDVLLTQFCLQLIRESNASFRGQIPPQKLNTDPGDGAMILGIIVFQKQSPRMIQDGFVSPFHTHSISRSGVFTLSLMQGTAMFRNTAANSVWPRIDKIPGCPPELANVIQREVGIGQVQPV